MSTKQKIILHRYQDGYSERRIARELGINRSTVHRYLTEYAQAREKLSKESEPKEELIEEIVKIPKYNSSNRGSKKFTNEISQEVDRLLQANDEKRSRGLHKQLMKKIDILEHLHDLGYDIGYTSLCDHINRKLDKRKEAYVRQEYEPGDICEFDWGEVKLEIGGKMQKLYMAVFTPAMSNYRYAVLFHRQDTAAFLQAHVLFFEHVGGVFHTMVYDNMRVAIRRFVGSTTKEPTEALLKLSVYYQFGFRFCNVARGNEKGHVERSVEFVRRKAFGHTYRFASLEAANAALHGTCNRLNTRFSRDNQGKRAVDLLEVEKKQMAPVPPSYDCSELEQCKVDKYSVITYGTNRYSVPDHLVGRIVDVKVYPQKLCCYYNKQKICEHERQYSHHGWYINLDHYLHTLQVKPGALAGSKALASAPKNVKEVFSKYFADNPKDFVALLIFLQENRYPFSKATQAIDKLLQSSPRDISLDKIKVLCMQRSEVYVPPLDNNDHILQQSQAQLEELSELLHY